MNTLSIKYPRNVPENEMKCPHNGIMVLITLVLNDNSELMIYSF